MKLTRFPARLNAFFALTLLGLFAPPAHAQNAPNRSLLFTPPTAPPVQATYRPPSPWNGTTIGKIDGGSVAQAPKGVGATGSWQLLRVWPDDPLKAANYRPLLWNGKQWNDPKDSFGGQPSAKTESGVVLTGRGPWQGEEGYKLPALGFTAPQSGKYMVAATLTSSTWEASSGDGLMVLRRDCGAGTVENVTTVVVTPQAPAPLSLSVSLKAGQELLFVPRYPGYNSAGSVTLGDLKIGFYSAANVKDFVVVGDDGHLSKNGKRIRFWGVIGGFPGQNHRDTTALVQRFKGLGFNMVRHWEGSPDWTDNYLKGDNSDADRNDFFLNELGKNGLHVWLAALNNVGRAAKADVNAVSDPLTAEPWSQAVGDGMDIRGNVARIWDTRLEAIGIERMKAIARHRNAYNGLRWADDPTIAIWELSNEEWWFGHMIGGDWQRLPPFFQAELLTQWNRFLQNKYGTEGKLRTAWLNLLPDESLDKQNVLLLPLASSASPDPQRLALGVGIKEGVQQKYSRADFNRQRGADVIEFLLQIWIAHKKREADAVKSVGIGTRVSPFVWDTGIGYEIQAQYLHQQADVVAHDTYITGFHHDRTSERFPWFSGLEELPRMCWDRPWIEHNRVEGKPYLVYETQIEQPAKYRAEYPMRVASLGAIQDWDAVCWHYFGGTPDSSKPRPYAQAMDVTQAGGHPQGYHYQFDEVQQSAMRAASAVFRNGLVKPAPSPTTFIYGRNSLLDPASMDYGHSYGDIGEQMMPTTYRYGVRIQIDPTREIDEVRGPTYKPRVYEPNPIRPHDEIEYNWRRGHLRFDAPGAAMYVGFLANYGADKVTFAKSGVTLGNVKIVSPPRMPYPVTEREKYVEFCIATEDGLPLALTKRAVLSLVSTSFNSGFTLDESKITQEFGWWLNSGATVSVGKTPVLVARVGATVAASALTGMHYRLLDFDLKIIGQGPITGGKLVISADKPVFYVELTR